MSNNYQGFDSPYYPGYNQPYDRCSCGGPDACGNEHKSAITLTTMSRANKNGTTDQLTVVNPVGKMYANTVHRPFAVWDGHLALSDLKPPKVKPYQPPGYAYVCDRPMAGSSLCSMSGGSCNP